MSRLWSVRARITLAATVLVAVAIAVAAVMIVRLVERDLVDATERTIDAALDHQSEALEGIDEPRAFTFEVHDQVFTVGPFDYDDDPGAGEEWLFGRIVSDDGLVAEIVIDANSGEVLDVLDPETDRPIDEPELLETIQDTIFEVRLVEGVDGTEFLVAGDTLDEVRESVDAVRSALWVIGPLLVAACGVLVWVVVGRALRPVAAISTQVGRISVENLHERVPVPAGVDEISELATLMNRMLGRVEEGAERQRRFSSDASHELRSPLSSVTLAAELIAADPSNDRAGRLADDIVAEAGRMNLLIDDLLLLARSEDAAPLTDEVDVVAIASEVAAGAGADFRSPSDAAVVVGDELSLRRVVTNLVENARRYGDGRVLVAARSDGPLVHLTVEDDGPGIAVDDRERVFERFTRLDEARSRDEGGTGIGLALVAAIVERHRGRVWIADSDALGGAAFHVTLPASGRPD